MAPFAATAEPDTGDDESDEGAAGEGAAGEGAEPETDDHPLLGAWVHDVGGCSYTHSFNASGVYRMVATTGEIVVANYEMTAPREEAGRWLLSFTIVSDNNVVDCEGMQNDEVGDSHSAYVEPVGDDVVNIYRAATGGTSFVWMRR